MDKPEETAFDYMLSKLSGKKKKKSKSGKKSGSPQTEVQIGQFSKRESDSSSVSLSSRYTMPGIQQDKHYDVSYPLRTQGVLLLGLFLIRILQSRLLETYPFR